MAKLIWADGILPEIKKAAEPFFEEFAELIPIWVKYLYVDYERAEGVAHSNTKEEYRNSCITFEAAFLDQPVWKRREDVLHEIMHTATNPMYNQMFDLKDVAVKAHPEMADYLAEQIRHSVERTVVDLTECVLNALEKARVDERSRPPSSGR